jgi:hypothetical protein
MHGRIGAGIAVGSLISGESAFLEALTMPREQITDALDFHKINAQACWSHADVF